MRTTAWSCVLVLGWWTLHGCSSGDKKTGQAAVETLKRPGRGALRMHVRALAPLYTGHLGAEQLAVSGAIAGPAAALARATALFATASPSLPDFF